MAARASYVNIVKIVTLVVGYKPDFGPSLARRGRFSLKA
jgi:hypothetical protein